MSNKTDFDHFIRACYRWQNSSQMATLVWLKRYRWIALFDWDTDRKIERHTRIVRKAFPNGISQADFMKMRKGATP